MSVRGAEAQRSCLGEAGGGQAGQETHGSRFKIGLISAFSCLAPKSRSPSRSGGLAKHKGLQQRLLRAGKRAEVRAPQMGSRFVLPCFASLKFPHK